MEWINVNQDRNQLSGSCKYDTELSGLIKGRQIVTDTQYNSTYPDAVCPDHQFSGSPWAFG